MNEQPVFIGKFAIGDQPQFSIKTFTVAGALGAPSTLKVLTRNPAGTETVYTNGSSSEIVAGGTGLFTFTLPRLTATHVGSWYLRVNTTGTNIAKGAEHTFECLPSEFDIPLP